MSGPQNCKVTILDEDYVLVTDESADHVMHAARVVDESVRAILGQGLTDQKKGVVLTAIRLASLLRRQEQELLEYKKQSHEAITRLEHMIDSFSKKVV